MNGKPKVVYMIAPDGGVMIEVNGVKGQSCLDLTADIEAALGTVMLRTETPEMNEREVTHVQADVLRA